MPRYDALKRAIDVAVSGAGLVVAAPVMAATAIAVKQQIGSPVFFRQQRPGLGGKPFELVKFRSMLPEDATHRTDAERLTPVGKVIRATSLDELPTLWNVFKGDMSLVGPRPLLMQYLPLYTPTQARRHEVRPGITGLAQSLSRNNTTWAQRLAQDVYYVDHRSLRLDAQILARTVGKVVRRADISQAGEATMSIFTGAPDEAFAL